MTFVLCFIYVLISLFVWVINDLCEKLGWDLVWFVL